MLGASSAYVANLYELLKECEFTIGLVEDGVISPGAYKRWVVVQCELMQELLDGLVGEDK